MRFPTRYAPAMPAIVTTLTPDGLIETPYSGERISEIASQEPEGVYDVTRTYAGGRALLLGAYFERLERSAQLEGMVIEIDRQETRWAIRHLLGQSGFEEARLRLTVPREAPQNLIIALADYAPYKSELQKAKARGVKVATVEIARRNPAAKTNDWVHERAEAKATLPDDVYEGIIVDEDGKLLEGFSSNFYVVRQGSLHTADEDILSGIARRILLEVAPNVLSVELAAPSKGQLSSFDEAMLTSSGRGAVPVVQIDGYVLGDGRPGHFTQQLMQQYDEWMEAHLEAI